MITKEESMSLTARIGRYIAEEAPITRYTVDELAAARMEFGEEDLLEMRELGLYDGDFETFFVIREFLGSIGLGDVADGAYIAEVFASAKKQDSGAFAENPYLAILKGLPAKSGRFVLMPSVYERGEIFSYDMPDFTRETVVPKLGFFPKRVFFPTLYENDRPWMSICPSEIHSMKESIDKAHGRVLVLGLGLGYYAYEVAQKPSVESVTVIELSPDVITLFRDHIEPKLDFGQKLSLVQSDAVAYLRSLSGGEFDFCFADIWEGAVDGARWYKEILPQEKRLQDTEFSYWIEDAILEYLKKT